MLKVDKDSTHIEGRADEIIADWAILTYRIIISLGENDVAKIGPKDLPDFFYSRS